MSAAEPPAGWYDDPTQPGVARWWDGTRWTDHVQVLAAPSPPPAPEPTQAWLHEPPGRRSWWRQRRVLVPAGVVSLAIVASVVADTGRSDEVAVDTAEATADELDDQINRLVDDVDDTDPDRETTSAPPSTTTSMTTTTTITTTESSTALVEVSATDADGSATSSSTTATTATSTTPAPTTAPPTTAPPTTAPPTTPAPTTAPPTTAATTTTGCHPAYSPCIPFFPGDALNCGDLSAGQRPVTVLDVNVDPYGLDGDNDGRGCES